MSRRQKQISRYQGEALEETYKHFNKVEREHGERNLYSDMSYTESGRLRVEVIKCPLNHFWEINVSFDLTDE